MRLGLGTGSTARHFVELLGERVRGGLERRRGADLGGDARAGRAVRHPADHARRDARTRPDRRRRRRDRARPDPDQGRRRRAVARKDRGGGVGAHDGDRRRSEMGADAGALSAAGRGRAVRAGGDAARGRGGCRGLRLPGPTTLRQGKDGHAFVTDGGHWILDAALERIADPRALAERLARIPGVVEHGLFIGLAHAAVIAGPQGRARRRAA